MGPFLGLLVRHWTQMPSKWEGSKTKGCFEHLARLWQTPLPSSSSSSNVLVGSCLRSLQLQVLEQFDTNWFHLMPKDVKSKLFRQLYALLGVLLDSHHHHGEGGEGEGEEHVKPFDTLIPRLPYSLSSSLSSSLTPLIPILIPILIPVLGSEKENMKHET
jgi:hypothetical protein